jgi:hypothetical protein
MRSLPWPRLLALLALPWLGGTVRAAPQEPADAAAVWSLDRTDAVGGAKATVKGAPRVVGTPAGKAVEFDGQKDALVVDRNPLRGLAAFTLEAVFRPDADGPKEQRFVHVQEDGSENRAMLETRVMPDGTWYADTYLRSGKVNRALADPKKTHPAGRWHNLTLVYDGQEMIQYVNGERELSSKFALAPLGDGKTSIGARLNDVHWFKGAVRTIRVTPRALKPEEMLKAE